VAERSPGRDRRDPARAFRCGCPRPRLLEFTFDQPGAPPDQRAGPTGRWRPSSCPGREIVTQGPGAAAGQLRIPRAGRAGPPPRDRGAARGPASYDDPGRDHPDRAASPGDLQEDHRGPAPARGCSGGGSQVPVASGIRRTRGAEGPTRPGGWPWRRMGRLGTTSASARSSDWNGNVGYLDVRRVRRPGQRGPGPSARAMELVAGTYALIIDPAAQRRAARPRAWSSGAATCSTSGPTHLNDIFPRPTPARPGSSGRCPFVPGTRYLEPPGPTWLTSGRNVFSGGEDFSPTRCRPLGRATVVGETTGGRRPPEPGAFPISARGAHRHSVSRRLGQPGDRHELAGHRGWCRTCPRTAERGLRRGVRPGPWRTCWPWATLPPPIADEGAAEAPRRAAGRGVTRSPFAG